MSDNTNKLCERCKSEQSSSYCAECQPFHSFCTRCDTIVHSLPIKMSHYRKHNEIINLPNYPHNQENQFDCNCKVHHSPKQSPKTYVYQNQNSPISWSLNKSEINHNNNNNNNNNNSTIKANNSPILRSKHNHTFSREYISEVNSVHDKEKNELQFKITALQNNIDRLKMSFQNQVQKMQEEADLTLRKAKLEHEDAINKHIQIINQKDIQMNEWFKENEEWKNKTNYLNNRLEEVELLTKQNSDCYNTQIKELKNEIISLKQVRQNNEAQSTKKIEEIMKTNINEIDKIKNRHSKQLEDIIQQNNKKWHKLQQENEMNFQENEGLKTLSIEQNEYIHNWEAEKKKWCYELQDLNDKYRNWNHIWNEELNRSNKMKNNYEQVWEENSTMKGDFDYWEKTIENLKNEISMLKEINAKKEKDFNNLLNQSEKIRKEFSEKMFDNEELENKCRIYMKENEVLRKQMREQGGKTYEIK